MYSAWRVVHKRFPKLPAAAPQLRTHWLLILSQGAADAQDHAEQACGIVELLWCAARHSDATVSAAAAAALAQFPLATLEALEIERPLSHWSQVRCTCLCLLEPCLRLLCASQLKNQLFCHLLSRSQHGRRPISNASNHCWECRRF